MILGRPISDEETVSQYRSPLGLGVETYLPSIKNVDLIGDESWIESALCKIIKEDRDWFSNGKRAIARAKEVCNECPVAWECLMYSVITQQQVGVWGALDQQERAPLLKEFQEQLELSGAEQ